MLALALAGCGAPVAILTGGGGLDNSATDDGSSSCYTSFIVADLVTDPTYGTAVVEHDPNGDRRYPVMWLPGMTGRQSGSEVEILNRHGEVVARTGTHVQVEGGFDGDSPTVWVACGYVNPVP